MYLLHNMKYWHSQGTVGKILGTDKREIHAAISELDKTHNIKFH